MSTVTLAAQNEDNYYLPIIMLMLLSEDNEDPPIPITPVDLCQGYAVNDTSNHPMTALTKPAPGQTYTDPVFGSNITRVSNSDAIPSGIIKTMYNTVQAWNADESQMILWHRGDGHHLYNGINYTHLQRLPITPADLEQVFWSTTNNNTFIYPNQASGQVVQTAQGNVTLQGNELVEYNISNQRHRIIRDFNNLCATADISSGNDVQMTSRDNDVIGLHCADQGFSYQISTDTVTLLSGSANSLAPQPFPSGNLFYHQGRILNPLLNTVTTLDLGNVSEHASLGSMHNGNDAYFSVAFDGNSSGDCNNGIGSLVVHELPSGSCRVLVGPATGYPYTLSGTHPSALAFKNPGWVVVSSIGYGVEGDSLLEQELYLANSDPADQKVCRIAHHRATGRRGSVGYFAEPHPVISPSGTRVLFSSDWNNSGQVDVFVVELPAYNE